VRNPALGIPVPRTVAGLRVETRLIRSRGYDPATAPQISEPAQAVALAAKLTQSDRERILVFYLSTQNRVLGIQQLSVGALASALAPVDAILRTALLAGAAGFIVVHNHPSGDPTPSGPDKDLHQRLTRAAELVDLRLLDSVVVGDGRWTSLRDRGGA